MKTRSCIVGCPHYSSLHKFPDRITDTERRAKWLALLGGDPNKNTLFACDRHFSWRMKAAKMLIQNALPDINLQTNLFEDVISPIESQEIPETFIHAAIGNTIIRRRSKETPVDTTLKRNNEQLKHLQNSGYSNKIIGCTTITRKSNVVNRMIENQSNKEIIPNNFTTLINKTVQTDQNMYNFKNRKMIKKIKKLKTELKTANETIQVLLLANKYLKRELTNLCDENGQQEQQSFNYSDVSEHAYEFLDTSEEDVKIL